MTDGDADRTGAMDGRGQFVDPHKIMALALQYLVEQRGWRGAVVKTVSTTRMVNRLAELNGLQGRLHKSGRCEAGELQSILSGHARTLLFVAWLTVAALLWMAWDKEHAPSPSQATSSVASSTQ